MAPSTTKAATPKATSGAGVRKAGRPKGVVKNNKAKTAMIKMQAYCKSHTTRKTRVIDRVCRKAD